MLAVILLTLTSLLENNSYPLTIKLLVVNTFVVTEFNTKLLVVTNVPVTVRFPAIIVLFVINNVSDGANVILDVDEIIGAPFPLTPIVFANTP